MMAIGDSALAAKRPGDRSIFFYMNETDHHGHAHLYRWLLDHARQLGLPGGTARRSMRGFGRSGHFHDMHLVDTSLSLGVQVQFQLREIQASQLLASLEQEHPGIVYFVTRTELGVT